MLRYTCVVIVDAKLRQLRYLWRDIEIPPGPRCRSIGSSFCPDVMDRQSRLFDCLWLNPGWRIVSARNPYSEHLEFR